MHLLGFFRDLVLLVLLALLDFFLLEVGAILWDLYFKWLVHMGERLYGWFFVFFLFLLL
jgi:hypothetical protein